MTGRTSEDDVVFIGSTSTDPFLCSLCPEDLTKYTPEARELHYSYHLDPPSTSKAAPSTYKGGSSSKTEKFLRPFTKAAQKFHKEPSREVFWYPSKCTPPPPNYTPALVHLIRKSLNRLHDKGHVQKAHICYSNAVHVSHDNWDSGWGCGYRNFLMACATLMERCPEYSPLLDHPLTPGVRNLQKWIEQAWKDGFDTEGAADLKNRLCGTNKWIGTAELYVAFSYRGIPCRLVDFDFTGKKDKSPLYKWITEYFSESSTKHATVNDALRGATAVVVTDKMPLILQHEGHSRTIIGFQRLKNGSIELLMFDPRPLPKPVRFAALRTSPGSDYHPPPTKPVEKATFQKVEERKRKASNTSVTMVTHTAKRVRGYGSDDGVIVIDSDDENQPEPSTKPNSKDDLDPAAVLKPFILKIDSLNKKKYQILYFPLTEPLDEQARLACRVVTSTKGV